MFFNIQHSTLIVIISLVSCGSMLGNYVAASESPSPANPLTVNGIECNANEQFLIHIHAHLSIFANGQSPVKKDFTLGQFFDLWKNKLNNPQVFNDLFNGKNKNNNMPQIYINGNKLPSRTNYKDVKLHPHDEIVL